MCLAHTLNLFNIPNSLQGRNSYYLQFTDEESKAQRVSFWSDVKWLAGCRARTQTQAVPVGLRSDHPTCSVGLRQNHRQGSTGKVNRGRSCSTPLCRKSFMRNKISQRKAYGRMSSGDIDGGLGSRGSGAFIPAAFWQFCYLINFPLLLNSFFTRFLSQPNVLPIKPGNGKLTA